MDEDSERNEGEQLLECLKELERLHETREKYLLEMHESERIQLTNEKLRFLNSLCIADLSDLNESEITHLHNSNTVDELQHTSEQKSQLTDRTPTDTSVNEIPIIPSYNNFTELLETELRTENLKKVTSKTSKSNNPKPYLKRGEGLRRFKMSREDVGRTNDKMPWMKIKKSKAPKADKKKEIKTIAPLEKASKKQLDFVSNEENTNDSYWPNVPESWEDIMKRLTVEPQNYASDSSLVMSPSLSKFTSKREIAEQKMFDLVEEKLENCSLSSTNSFFVKAFRSDFNKNSQSDQQLLGLDHLPTTISSCKSKGENFDKQSNVRLESDDKRSQSDDANENEYAESFHSDDTTISSDTEETCRIANHDIPTSTPNHDNVPNFEKKIQINDMESNKKKIVLTLINHDKTACASQDMSGSQTLTESSISTKNESSIDNNLSYQQIICKFEKRIEDLGVYIDILRNENSNLRKEMETEKKQFIEENAQLEAKMNEDKIISEYYLAEEREKLQKKMSLYDRQIREMKGQLLHKDKEELVSLNKEIVELKKQIESKNAKHGAMQARLRNQLKSLENENKDMKEVCEKLKKENRKLKTVNARTNKLANIRMLAEINKSLINKADDIHKEDNLLSNDRLSETFNDLKSNIHQKSISNRNKIRMRTKSAPNLNVTSRYAKFFSEKKLDPTNVNIGYGLQSDSSSENDDGKYDYSTKEILTQKSDFHEPIQFNDSLSKSITNDSSKVRYIAKCSENYDKKSSQDLCIDKVNEINLSTPKISSPKMQNAYTNRENTNEEKTEKTLSDGSLEISFSNGNSKIISPDGFYSKFTFYNGDTKEVFANGIIKYFYKNQNIHQTSYRDGSEVLHFPDNYIEQRYPDGTVQCHLPDGTVKWIKPGNVEECKFPDGTLVSVNNLGEQMIRFPNGQVEIHTSEFMKREFPDGTVKVAYADGIVETRFASGRIRIKDKSGNLIMDTLSKSTESKL